MNRIQAKQLLDEITQLAAAIKMVETMVRDFTDEQPRRTAPHGLDVGTQVRVYAACSDKNGEMLLGELAIVVVNDPEAAIPVVDIEVVSGNYEGQRFQVLPQQCILAPEGE